MKQITNRFEVKNKLHINFLKIKVLFVAKHEPSFSCLFVSSNDVFYPLYERYFYFKFATFYFKYFQKSCVIL